MPVKFGFKFSFAFLKLVGQPSRVDLVTKTQLVVNAVVDNVEMLVQLSGI